MSPPKRHADSPAMVSSLQRGLVLDQLAEHLYDFLPGTPHPFADQTVSFEGVAAEVGVAGLWPGGSKRPAIRRLLEGVMDSGKGRFSPLMVKIVERALTYRRSNPITREEIDRLNELLRNLQFQIPELTDAGFLQSLPQGTRKAAPPPSGVKKPAPEMLAQLQSQLMQITNEDPQRRGYAFESFLSSLSDAYGLAPRGSFRLTGEQIDGSFQLQRDTYLLEAKWQAALIGNADLLGFSGKVEGKAQWTRGLFVSYSGFSPDGLKAFTVGRRTSIICMDGLDLSHVLAGRLDLVEVLQSKERRASETNRAFVPVRELFPSVI